MVSSSLSSSSSSLMTCHKRKFSLDSLPEDLLVEISSHIAASSFSAVSNLKLVSNSFKRICDERYVIHRLSLNELPLFPWLDNSRRFSKFLKRCRKYGNPDALYRKGLIKYFIENQKPKGLKLLAEATRKGNQEATYVYGMILICVGDNTKQKGFKILSSLVKPLMSKTMKALEELRYKIRDHLWWRGRPIMKQLKRSYVREKCECNGCTRKFLVTNCVWHRYGEDNDIITSSACEFCLWHREVELFYDNIEIDD